MKIFYTLLALWLFNDEVYAGWGEAEITSDTYPASAKVGLSYIKACDPETSPYEAYTGSGGAMYITSPNYPNNYENNLDCEWNITTAPGNSMRVRMVAFALEDDDNCEYDYLQFDNATKLCGETFQQNYASEPYTVNIKFHTDASVTHTGFILEVHSVPNKEAPELACAQRRSSDTVITSPGFPGYYPGWQDCWWSVQARPGQSKVSILVKRFQLEGPTIGYDNECLYDALEFYNEPDMLPVVYCGDMLAPGSIFAAAGKNLTIRFHSDDSADGRFKLKVIEGIH